MAECINREAATRALLNDAPEQVSYSREDAADCIRYMDAADVAPVRHGRWEPYFEEVEIYNAGGFAEREQTGWICGRCKSVESITRYYKTNYCPNCGARMDEVE